jgi:hypothetical protein
MEGDVSSNLDIASVLLDNSGMKRPLLLGVTVLVALATLTQTAPACGDPPAHAVAGPKAQLAIGGRKAVSRLEKRALPASSFQRTHN